MKLYLLSQNVNNNYDTYDSCVVCAHNINDAKSIHPNDDDDDGFKDRDNYGNWVKVKDEIKCTYLGDANHNVARGVIVSSFNAG